MKEISKRALAITIVYLIITAILLTILIPIIIRIGLLTFLIVSICVLIFGYMNYRLQAERNRNRQ